MQNPIYDTITSNHLNYHQKLNALWRRGGEYP